MNLSRHTSHTAAEHQSHAAQPQTTQATSEDAIVSAFSNFGETGDFITSEHSQQDLNEPQGSDGERKESEDKREEGGAQGREQEQLPSLQPDVGATSLLRPPPQEHLARAVVSLTHKTHQCAQRIAALELRLVALEEKVENVPSPRDLLEVRIHAAKLAAELAKTTVELRNEISETHPPDIMAPNIIDVRDRNFAQDEQH